MIEPREIKEKLTKLASELRDRAWGARLDHPPALCGGFEAGLEEAADTVEEFIAVEIISKYGAQS